MAGDRQTPSNDEVPGAANPAAPGVSRRGMLSGALIAGLGGAVVGAAGGGSAAWAMTSSDASTANDTDTVDLDRSYPFYGTGHQGGIATPTAAAHGLHDVPPRGHGVQDVSAGAVGALVRGGGGSAAGQARWHGAAEQRGGTAHRHRRGLRSQPSEPHRHDWPRSVALRRTVRPRGPQTCGVRRLADSQRRHTGPQVHRW